MDKRKIFAIGDIHGCKSHLERLISELDIDADRDILVFMGDYVDRGPDPKGVIDFIIDLKTNIKNVVCLSGNHEEMFLNYCLDRRDEELYMANGGMRTLESYGFAREGTGELILPENNREFFSGLRTYYETDEYIFVHAGLRPGIPLDRQEREDLIWIRFEFINSGDDFGKTVVYGHTPVSLDQPRIEKNKIGIDTGAVYGGKLTCVKLPDMKIYQV
ncbi:MAG TPA: metallophosphoesterase family protein [Syntrophales bacterium]|nr:metallophosphoesterase family protein [Syntrophales bacterium]